MPSGTAGFEEDWQSEVANKRTGAKRKRAEPCAKQGSAQGSALGFSLQREESGKRRKSLLNHCSALASPVSKRVFARLDMACPPLYLKEEHMKKCQSHRQYILEHKEKNPNTLILLESGPFFSAYGIDAVLLMEFANLQPTGGRPQVGTKRENLRMTLARMTSNGFCVAVYLAEGKKKILAQIVTPESPTYYGESICEEDVLPCVPRIGVSFSPTCATIVCLHSQSGESAIYKGVPLASVRGILESVGCPETVEIMGGVAKGTLPFRTTALAWACAPEAFSAEYVRRYAPKSEVRTITGQALNYSTASQLGIVSTVQGIPSLVASALERNATEESKTLLRQLLLVAPKGSLRGPISETLKEYGAGGGFNRQPPPLRYETIRLCLRKGKATAGLLRKISLLVKFAVSLTSESLFRAARILAGKQMKFATYKKALRLCSTLIDERCGRSETVSLCKHWRRAVSEDYHGDTTEAFVKVKQDSVDEAWDTYVRVAVRGSVSETSQSALWDSQLHGFYWTRDGPLTPPKTRVWSRKKKKWRKDICSTARLDTLRRHYHFTVTAAAEFVKTARQILCAQMCESVLPMLRVAVCACSLHRCLLSHVRAATGAGWCHATVGPAEARPYLENARPYWLRDGQRNTLDFSKHGLHLLTGANMGGKTTLCRTLCSAVVLARLGFMVPASVARIPEGCGVFLRTGGSDCPEMGQSGFGLEMDELSTLCAMACAVPGVLVVGVDELGKGTSNKEGSQFALAVMRYLMQRNVVGYFATHYEDVELLSLVPNMQMECVNGKSTFRLVPGVCGYRWATEVGRHFGVPEELCGMVDRLLTRKAAGGTQDTADRSAPHARALTDRGRGGGRAPIHASQWMGIAEEVLRRPCDSQVFPGEVPGILNSSVLYVLEDSEGVYVGESDAIHTRWKVHAQRRKALKCMRIWRMDNKSEAKRMETALQKKMLLGGVVLSSAGDRYNTAFGRNAEV